MREEEAAGTALLRCANARVWGLRSVQNGRGFRSFVKPHPFALRGCPRTPSVSQRDPGHPVDWGSVSVGVSAHPNPACLTLRGTSVSPLGGEGGLWRLRPHGDGPASSPPSREVTALPSGGGGGGARPT